MYQKEISVQNKSIEGLSNWLVKNFDYYLETLEIVKTRCRDCEENNPNFSFSYKPSAKCKYKVFKKELEFFKYYESLQKLLALKTISSEIMQPLVVEFYKCKADDELLYKWLVKADDIECTSQNTCFIENVIVYENKKATAMKPTNTKLYKLKPFIIPITGFEGFIEYKYILSEILNTPNPFHLL